MCSFDRHAAARRIVVLAVGAIALGLGPRSLAHDLMPAPLEYHAAPGRLAVTPNFPSTFAGVSDRRLDAALARFLAGIGRRARLTLHRSVSGLGGLEIRCTASGPEIPGLGANEAYILEIGPRGAVLTAAEDAGVMRGLATLTQLLQHDAAGWFFPAVTVRDEPRFPWRGLLIDVCRHWEPMEVIKRNLDGMALVKLNVLHLHLTEDQGFRIESKKFPRLQEMGSDGKFFTQDQMREIIAYAAERGIRVVPEFDIPGHATSWVVGFPELASAPGPYQIERHWGVFDPVLDPTNPRLYELLDGFLGEMAALFPDEYIHIGGDENNGVQWNANPAIQAFIRDHGLKDNAGLHAYFNGKVQAILAKHGKKLIGWDEILHPDLPAGSVIHSWRGADGVAAATARGFATVLSHGYYIDLCYPAAGHYLNDPIPPDSTLTPAQRKLVLGGEATMWGEQVNPDTIDRRIWPRTAAIAERLWSPGSLRDVDDMYRRLAIVDQRLTEAGLRQDEEPHFDLPGVEPDGPTAKALLALSRAVEPVKKYRRGGLQPEVSQLNPTNELADWAHPESDEAREFNRAVDQWLFADGVLNGAGADRLADQLQAWRMAGEAAARSPASLAPIPQGRLIAARQLAAISQAGLDSLAALRSGNPLSAPQRAAIAATLDAATVATAAAVEFPQLTGLRLLAAAAAEPGARNRGAPSDWRDRLRQALPPPANDS